MQILKHSSENILQFTIKVYCTEIPILLRETLRNSACLDVALKALYRE